MVVLEFPVRFENPLFGILGVILGVIFVILFYLSHKRLRIAEKRLELVKWQTVRRVINFTNIGMKIGVIVALSFLLAIPYFPITLEVPIEELSEEQLAQTSVTVMLLMDVSYSMNYSDLKPSRLQVAKQIAKLLVNNMSSADLIGFVSFAGKIYDETLPTLNRSNITNMIDNQTLHPSTAIGTALETALGVLETYQGGKAIVLFSDGKNNFGIMNLTSVAEAAAAMEIPVFTVFLGTYGIWEADPIALEEVSDMTGGKFYEVKSEEMKALVTEVSTISKEVKVGALKTAFDTLTFESKDYHTPMLFFAALLVVSLFLTWFTGV
jgi:Ca-activated chloride channel family protein